MSEVEKIIKERDEARHLVLRLVVASYRDGWEDGESENETLQFASDMLYNWKLDPHNDHEATQTILKGYNPEVQSLLRSNQTLRDVALSELESIRLELEGLEDKPGRYGSYCNKHPEVELDFYLMCSTCDPSPRIASGDV